MALAVIAVTKNGIPVSQAAAPFGLPVTVSTNGYGLAVIPVASGGRPVFDTTGTLFGPAVIPANTVLPVITGTTQVGSTLMTSSGTWSGTAATYTYQWQRNAAGYATFNGAVSPVVVMSNGNLTATHSVSTNSVGTSSAAFKNTGKYYFEATLEVSRSTGVNIGIVQVADFTQGSFEVTGTAVRLGSVNCLVFSNGADTAITLGSCVVNDVFGFAIDLTARLAWIRRNNGNWNANASANPATGVGGFTIVAGSFTPALRFHVGGPTDVITGNFGASAFTQAVPSGFTAGWLT